jgi:hypothetical protein
VAWWINIRPAVVQGIESFGFHDPPPDKILEFVEHYLSQFGEEGVDRGLKEGQFRALGRGHGELPGEADGA